MTLLSREVQRTLTFNPPRFAENDGIICTVKCVAVRAMILALAKPGSPRDCALNALYTLSLAENAVVKASGKGTGQPCKTCCSWWSIMLSVSSAAVSGVKIASMSSPMERGETTANAVEALWLMLPNRPGGHSGWRRSPMPGTALLLYSRSAWTAAIRPAKCSACRLRPQAASWA